MSDLPTTRPAVPRPPVAPCGVIAVMDAPISDSDPEVDFPASRPPGCTGPTSKIVLEFEHGFDAMVPRPMELGVWIDGVNLAYAEARQGQDPPATWEVERDVTDYAALFARPGAQGRIRLDPEALWAEPSLMMRVSLRIVFYPQGPGAAAPRKPDRVYALGPDYGAQTPVDSVIDGTSARVRLPRDIERVYADVLMKNSSVVSEACVPRTVAQAMPTVVRHFSEPGVSGRLCEVPVNEVRVFIDGRMAGVAPLEPRYGLREVAPRALHPLPYRVDLSPFAGALSDGNVHDVRFTVGAANSYPSLGIAGALLVYRDPHSTIVSGAVTRNTLHGNPATPAVTHGLVDNGGRVTGPVRTFFTRSFVIDGYVDTARGRLWHRVVQDTYLDNRQQHDAQRPGQFDYRFDQDTTVVYKTWRTSYTTLNGRQLRRDAEYVSYPLVVSDLAEWVSATGASETRLELAQGIHRRGDYNRSRITPYTTRLDERYANLAHQIFNSTTSFWDARTASDYDFVDNRGSCYDATWRATTSGAELTRGAGCPGGTNSVRWFARPDGEPESLGWAGYD
ncbi:MAG TPA: peptide-N4-asparagine amidase [Lysobacter sp.]|nr:peptide-N4-asparagine amidase [Lysobacter sp.]